jgi:S1-C subfamily serine protease
VNTVHSRRALRARGPLDSSGLRKLGSFQTALVFLVTIGVLTLPTRLQATDNAAGWIQSIHDANIDSIVFLTSIGKVKNGVSETLNGTGFIVHQSGYVLTCNHVFPDKPDYVSVERTAVIGGRYGTVLPVKIIRRDEQADLMLLKLPQGKPWRSVKSAVEARVGSDVVAVGFPTDMEMVDTPGSITGVDSDGRWLTSAGLNHGMSGGPAFDRSGAIIGIVEGGHEELKALDLLTPISFATSLLQSQLDARDLQFRS